jgi:beta-galactosidase
MKLGGIGKGIGLAAWLALVGCGQTGSSSGDAGLPSPRADVLIDDGWQFVAGDVPGAAMPAFDDSSWTAVSLPHTWNASDGQTPTYYRGPGWYRRHFTPPSAFGGRKLYLQFDAANKVADVFVNGTQVGEHRGGNAIFRFDVTPMLQIGADNVIAVKVDNSAFPDVPPLSGDFTQFGGLYRDTHVIVTDPVHIDVLDHASPGVFVTPKHVTAASADLDVRVELVNDDTMPHDVDVEVDVYDASGTMVKTLSMPQTLAPSPVGMNTQVTLTATIASPHLWDGLADPYLYLAQAVVKDGGVVRDAVSQTFGFRFYSIDPNTGFSLNGHPLDLHGVNRHQEWQGLGWAITTKEIDSDLGFIRELGANVIRGCHYQHSQYFYGQTDQAGILVWAEVGIVNSVTSSAAFDQNATQQLTELIRQSYNHPSIFVWSLSNETLGGDPLMMALNGVAHGEDPTRSTTLADNPVIPTAATAWDGRAAIPDVVGFNFYGGWYYGADTDVGPFVDGIHQLHPAGVFGMSEYGAGASIKFHSATPKAGDHTEEYQALFHETYWGALKTRPFVWGKFIWAMFDFASSTRNEGDTPGMNDKGLMTHDRSTRKDAFYFYKANWTTDPFVWIASRRFNPRTIAATDIKVYANTDAVELKLNGTSLGSKTNADHVFVWPAVTLTTGDNQVDAIGTKAGVSTYTDSVTWTLQ